MRKKCEACEVNLDVLEKFMRLNYEEVLNIFKDLKCYFTNLFLFIKKINIE